MIDTFSYRRIEPQEYHQTQLASTHEIAMQVPNDGHRVLELLAGEYPMPHDAKNHYIDPGLLFAFELQDGALTLRDRLCSRVVRVVKELDYHQFFSDLAQQKVDEFLYAHDFSKGSL